MKKTMFICTVALLFVAIGSWGAIVSAGSSGTWDEQFGSATTTDTALIGVNRTVTAVDGTDATIGAILLRGAGAGSVLNVESGASLSVQGGTAEDDLIKIGSNNGTKGFVNVNGGTMVSAVDMNVANNGSSVYGEFNVTSGSYTATANINIGAAGSSTGVVNLVGGSASVVHYVVGQNGYGELNISGGTHSGSGQVSDGSGGGAVNITAGSLAVNGVFLSGSTVFSISGGKLEITGTNNNRLQLGGRAGLNISDDGVLQWNFGNKGDVGGTVDTLIGSGEITFDAGENSGMLFADFDNSWTDGDGDILYAKADGGNTYFWVIPEPATLGLVSAFGGTILFIRRRFMI